MDCADRSGAPYPLDNQGCPKTPVLLGLSAGIRYDPSGNTAGLQDACPGRNAMRHRRWSRRDLLRRSTALAVSTLFAEPLRAVAPPATGVTPDLIAAARREGKLSYYSALELNVAERLAKAFEAKYSDISVRVERSGAERIFQRITQEQGSGINAVDVANSTDPAHYLDWKGKDWLAPYLPEDVAKHFPADQVDPDGTYATSCG
jgi:iron(III) transport system substrate-binding protein